MKGYHQECDGSQFVDCPPNEGHWSFSFAEQKNHFSKKMATTTNASPLLGLGLERKTNSRVRVTVEHEGWSGRAWAEKERACSLSCRLSKAASQVLEVEKGSELNQMDGKDKRDTQKHK